MTNSLIIFVFIILAILGVSHYVVYKTVQSIFSIESSTLLWVIRTVFSILAISFVAFTILASTYNNELIRILYTASAVWLGFLLYFFIASSIYGITLGILSIRNPAAAGSLGAMGIGLFIVAIIVGIYGLVHATAIKATQVDVHIPNLPSEWRGKKAVWASDWHLGKIHGQKFAKKVADQVNEADPDIVFIGGDLFDGARVDAQEMIRPLIALKPKLGTYFITGNHEGFGDSKSFLEAVNSVGIRVLNNEVVDLMGLQLIGVSDHDSASREDFSSVLKRINLDEERPAIMLKHQPNLLDLAQKSGVDLVISGHTHRAQVFPLSLIPKLVYRQYASGLNRFNDMQVYTSSGVGTWGPPFRVGTDSEIVVFTFR